MFVDKHIGFYLTKLKLKSYEYEDYLFVDKQFYIKHPLNKRICTNYIMTNKNVCRILLKTTIAAF